MRYICEINSFWSGKLDKMTPSIWLFDDQIVMTVHDMSTGDEEVYAASDIPHMSLLGFSDCVADTCYGVICLDEKRAMLHRYATASTTFLGISGVKLSDADRCVWNLWQTDTSGVDGTHGTIVINTINDIVSSSGREGSVIGKQTGFLEEVELFTLYDILGVVCRDLKLNLMRYETIQFFSSTKDYVTTIKLSQSAEAKRFYTKMYLDVSKA